MILKQEHKLLIRFFFLSTWHLLGSIEVCSGATYVLRLKLPDIDEYADMLCLNPYTD